MEKNVGQLFNEALTGLQEVSTFKYGIMNLGKYFLSKEEADVIVADLVEQGFEPKEEKEEHGQIQRTFAVPGFPKFTVYVEHKISDEEKKAALKAKMEELQTELEQLESKEVPV
jgi:hypothetical protein